MPKSARASRFNGDQPSTPTDVLITQRTHQRVNLVGDFARSRISPICDERRACQTNASDRRAIATIAIDSIQICRQMAPGVRAHLDMLIGADRLVAGFRIRINGEVAGFWRFA
jgi:hypothetical protein